MNDHSTTRASRGAHTATLHSYIVGFVFSIALTLAAYSLVVGHVATGETLLVGIVALGVAQLIVQLVFFLHLGKDKSSHWNLAAAVFTLCIVAFIVIGSLPILAHLRPHA